MLAKKLSPQHWLTLCLTVWLAAGGWLAWQALRPASSQPVEDPVRSNLADPGIKVTPLAVDPAPWDGGMVARQSVLEAQVNLKNSSQENCTITSVRVGCSCAEPKITQTTLAAGESTRLTVIWNVGAQRGPRQEVVWVEARLASGLRAGLPVRLHTTVVGAVDIDPWEVELLNSEWCVIRCTARDERPMQVLEATANHPAIEVKLLPGNRIQVRKRPDQAILGGLRLQIRTDHPQDEILELPLTWREMVSSPGLK